MRKTMKILVFLALVGVCVAESKFIICFTSLATMKFILKTEEKCSR